MQPELFAYGIHQENSDIRAHVSPLEKTTYIFKTKHGVDAIEANDPPLVFGYQKGVSGPTSQGWLVKPAWIEDLRYIRTHEWQGWNEYKTEWNTSSKGNFAVKCVLEIMKSGRFPLWVDATEDDRENVQLKGTDILLFAKKKIQVKCDVPLSATGNLFLQKAERNPLKQH